MDVVGEFDLDRFRVEIIHQELGRESWAQGTCMTPLQPMIVELGSGGWGHHPVHQFKFVRIDEVTYHAGRSGINWRGAVGDSIEQLVGRFAAVPELKEEDIAAALSAVARIHVETEQWD